MSETIPILCEAAAGILAIAFAIFLQLAGISLIAAHMSIAERREYFESKGIYEPDRKPKAGKKGVQP